jgi:hypothetical protein
MPSKRTWKRRAKFNERLLAGLLPLLSAERVELEQENDRLAGLIEAMARDLRSADAAGAVDLVTWPAAQAIVDQVSQRKTTVAVRSYTADDVARAYDLPAALVQNGGHEPTPTQPARTH